MLIDATHPEETRVVVLRGNRVEEFDFESAHRKQLRGNIYLAKVTRVEPSLQAAFVDYGGNRHGFLAFSEIHPDYYQIPVADRQALIDEEERAQRAADDEADRRSRRRHRDRSRRERPAERAEEILRSESSAAPGDADASLPLDETAAGSGAQAESADQAPASAESASSADPEALPRGGDEPVSDSGPDSVSAEASEETPSAEETALAVDAGVEPREEAAGSDDTAGDGNGENGDVEEVIESVGGADALEEVPDRAPRYRRQYKIQEVIKRRQVMLVQVVKEERGTKGAALTTYLSLAGRYSVLMPNTARGGGISRKITNSEDRSRLKEIAQELEVPEGMGVILRTAGASRTKTEIKRDFEYLLRLWETVRDLTLKSTAPKLVYEEGSLVKRSIRDLYTKDIDEVVVAGEEGYQEAKDFMRMLMPSHAKNVKLYKDSQPLFSRYGVENQLDAMFSPVVQLRSGGYIVLNQAEALVAIDVNSGRATREHHIEDTALKTNLEAADEIARQLRLRDLAGLIVIDFIDMDENRNNRAVERRLKECLKQDRARIQVGRISHFGLLEMSRQRIRTSVLESSTDKCPYCGGSGHVRSVSSLALQLLRGLEDQLIKGATHNLVVRTRSDVALYVLNQKRAHLRSLEERFRITVTINADDTVTAPQSFVVDRGEQVHTVEAAKAIAEQAEVLAAPLEEEDDLEEPVEAAGEFEAAEAGAGAEAEHAEGGGRKRRRRRRRGRREGGVGDEAVERAPLAAEAAEGTAESEEERAEAESEEVAAESAESQREAERRRRRRGRRGGRRSRREREGEDAYLEAAPERPAGPGFAPSEEFAAESSSPDRSPALERVIESELREAVADLDRGPSEPVIPAAPSAESWRTAVTQPASAPEPSHPAAAEIPAAQAPHPAAEDRPRRRSTVREPAPLAGGNGEPPIPLPPAAPRPVPPVIPETSEGEAEDANRPRRTGWWARRIAGD
jgi:ribonuclease E